MQRRFLHKPEAQAKVRTTAFAGVFILTSLKREQRARRFQKCGYGNSDAAQEACLHAVEEFDAFEGCTKGQYFGWLRAILGRADVDLMRRLHAEKRGFRQETSTDAPGFEEPLRNAASSAQDLAEGREQVQLGREVLSGFSWEYVHILRLRDEKCPWKAIGELLGRSADAARMLYKRALQEFAKQMESRQ